MNTDTTVARIVAFLEDIDIPAIAGEVPGDALLTGVTVCGGALVFDPHLRPGPARRSARLASEGHPPRPPAAAR